MSRSYAHTNAKLVSLPVTPAQLFEILKGIDCFYTESGAIEFKELWVTRRAGRIVELGGEAVLSFMRAFVVVRTNIRFDIYERVSRLEGEMRNVMVVRGTLEMATNLFSDLMIKLIKEKLEEAEKTEEAEELDEFEEFEE